MKVKVEEVGAFRQGGKDLLKIRFVLGEERWSVESEKNLKFVRDAEVYSIVVPMEKFTERKMLEELEKQLKATKDIRKKEAKIGKKILKKILGKEYTLSE